MKKIAFLGTFNHKKGSHLFAKLVQNETLRASWQFYILGNIEDWHTFNRLRLHLKGAQLYNDQILSTLCADLKLDALITPSIFPETYSRTFFAGRELGLPVLAPKNGNPYATLGDKYPYFYQDEKELVDKLMLLANTKNFTESKLVI